jgi:membrane fusion protein (multidrug efflux system)
MHPAFVMRIEKSEGVSSMQGRPAKVMIERVVHLLAGGALLIAVIGCDSGQQSSAPPAAKNFSPIPIAEVETALIRRGSIVQRISAPGSILARREAQVGAEVRGLLTEIFVDEGSRVEQGDPLFQIDPQLYRLALSRSEAALDRARAERRQLEHDLTRGRALRKKNVMAEQETDRIASGVEVAEAVEREVSEAVSMARRDVDRTTVRAPFAGSITRRLVDEGTTALVQPQTIVLVLQETHELEAIATIAEVHFAAIQAGDIAFLHVDGLALPITTRVEAVGDSVDPVTRTFRVRMRVPNPEYRLKAGLFARVEILPKAKSEVLLAPRSALRSLEGHTHVLVLRDGYAVQTPIEVGLIAEDAVEVLAGLRVDDEVIVGEAARNLGAGMRARARKSAAPPASMATSDDASRDRVPEDNGS